MPGWIAEFRRSLKRPEVEEYVDLPPIQRGFRQMIMLLESVASPKEEARK